MPTPPPEDQPISIGLAPRHWALLLTLLNEFITTKVPPLVEEIRTTGIDPMKIGEPLSTLIAGSIIAQGIMVKELTKNGVMTEEANQRIGLDRLMAEVKNLDRKES